MNLQWSQNDKFSSINIYNYASSSVTELRTVEAIYTFFLTSYVHACMCVHLCACVCVCMHARTHARTQVIRLLFVSFKSTLLSVLCFQDWVSTSVFPLKPPIGDNIGRLKSWRRTKRLLPSHLLPVGFPCLMSFSTSHNNMSSSMIARLSVTAAESNLHFSSTCKISHIEQVSANSCC